ncbi:DUF4145 domain-containing protein [Rhodopseudomonas boonkerdii]|uniref:DUF4145 domain-containing protein n=1 Tax=Rhodopseudomonas boonkerdii TaxID=475937 RepID=UPI001E3A386A|nr:DUF4145 domain-containing protein [Rhodopseudomonas boonkerdii]
MDWLQFISSIVASVAWPIAATAIVLNFKSELKRLLLLIKKVGAGSVSVEISDQVEQVRQAGEAVKLDQREDVPEVALDPGLINLAKNFPEAAVLQSFKSLEAVILRIRQRLPDDKPHRNLNEVLKALADDNQISQSAITLFQRLRQARNTAAHGEESGKLTPGEAIELINQITNLQELLEAVLEKLPRKSQRI